MPGQKSVKPQRRRRAQLLDQEKLQLPRAVTPPSLSQSQRYALRDVLKEVPGLFWTCGDHVQQQRKLLCGLTAVWQLYILHQAHSHCPHPWVRPSSAETPEPVLRQRCQRGVTPPAAGPSRPSGGSPSTTLLTCPRITPRLLEGLCSALHQEVTHWGGNQ